VITENSNSSNGIVFKSLSLCIFFKSLSIGGFKLTFIILLFGGFKLTFIILLVGKNIYFLKLLFKS
jgi:hypothetical protein